MRKAHDDGTMIEHIPEDSQGITHDQISVVPFIEPHDVEYVESSKRASPLAIPLCSDMKADTDICNTFSTFLTPEMVKSIFAQSDVIILQSRQLKKQRMLCLITNAIPRHLSKDRAIGHHEKEPVSSKCEVFSVRTLNKIKSVNIAVFMGQHDVFDGVFPWSHCFNHVYSGPDDAMLNRSVIQIGKHKFCIIKN